ncbi:MAG: folate-binding protein [Planktomarina sp.]|nr:folate-binding protein [Planktomarina sp.]MDT2039804.1 folate-binding protein [Planktomarina sp.]MDT2050065.1 folate-binding protein [Planktomarina sp.]|tara:strand:+ start:2009 stop:2740 length:732 start_codon:yes stop_codon:yes gene_type:complete
MGQPEQQRGIIQITGSDRVSFLQNLITNETSAIGLHYAALLNPQGKYIADFFVLVRQNDILVDVAKVLQSALASRLTMYRLRADVKIEMIECDVSCGLGLIPETAFMDPRSTALGWRMYGTTSSDFIDWQALRVEHIIPETGIELGPDKFLLEMDFERLNGVNFQKGCYVGQEIVARMKHKTVLRKGLKQIKILGSATPGSPILANGKPAGVIYTQHNGRALAYLRFDRVTSQMTAEDAIINL